ncbi:MAG: 5-(carboxyamino)imidazole ribonucleotide synthase [Bacteroidetes bacterium]|nr:5-(carboxyamino)imidazole ribonucleotide synthase [Bacteroidota bacterium]MDA0937322.1 5-(carboxyamino)imidazole ribonucleotide synthase [Bacteroidota bacterium]MDA1344810.1 5-(carboxyamino)imidazole ribonucleotide synthase [Bacteroidota bacterium]
MEFFSSNKILGILGGGQLGKMLLYTTRQWDVTTHVLDPNPSAPARLACNLFVKGDLMDFDTVYAFGKQVDVLTIEIENVNVEALKKLEQEGVHIYPQPHVLETIQNKCRQKKFYEHHQIPTAPFSEFENLEQLNEAFAKGQLSFPFVWKSAAMGYDGYGVSIVRSNADIAALQAGPCMAEEFVPFDKELAVIVCRNPSGEIATYPVVEMEFHPTANQVEYVLCPARIDSILATKARKIAMQVSAAYGHVGLLAVELFLTQDGEILVNEVAPRPHNSGHYTLEASYTSQFEQHLRALLNLPMGQTDSMVSAVMVNLVGKTGHQGSVFYKNIDQILTLEGVSPHIYGKKETRPFRKMGHVTIVHPKIETARSIAEQVKETVEVISK